MPKNDHEFDSLFENEASDDGAKEIEKLFTFDEKPPHEKIEEPQHSPAEKSVKNAPPQTKRTSGDFEPDMDTLLITAQSPLIIEGLKCLTRKDFSADTLQIYAEAIKGVEVFAKILERNPNNYYKLSAVIKADIHCKGIEDLAWKLYKMKHSSNPQTPGQILQAYQMLRNRLKIGYNKVLLSSSMIAIKKYFLLSGTLNQEKIAELLLKKDIEFREDMEKFTRHLTIAVQLTKIGDYEISKGLRGRDLNAFIIRASHLLAHCSHVISDTKSEEHYRRIHENHKKYFITR